MVKIMTAQRKTVGAMLGKNATVLPLSEYRGGARRTLYFTRPELNQLLGLYSRNVIRGVWRDYAIDHRDGQALFSIFRHTHESALYTIVKSAAGSGGEAQFTVLSGRQRVRVGRTLPEALDYFRSKLALVPGAGMKRLTHRRATEARQADGGRALRRDRLGCREMVRLEPDGSFSSNFAVIH